MTLTGTYKFEYEGGASSEITNPELEVFPIVNAVNPTTMTISVSINLNNDNTTVSVELDKVVVEDLNYDTTNPQDLIDRVVKRLEDYKI